MLYNNLKYKIVNNLKINKKMFWHLCHQFLKSCTYLSYTYTKELKDSNQILINCSSIQFLLKIPTKTTTDPKNIKCLSIFHLFINLYMTFEKKGQTV